MRNALAAALCAASLLSQTPASAGDVVRLGVLTDMSGVLSSSLGEGSVEATRLAVEEFGGTLLGKKIEVLSGDHQNKADVGRAIAQRWIDTQDVGIVLDLGNSAVAISVQNLVLAKNKISIATGAASGELTNKYCNPNSFHWGYDSYELTKALVPSMVKAGGNRWFFITVDYAFGHAVEADSSRLVEANGGKVVGAVRHPTNSADFSSYLLQAQSSGANVIAFASSTGDVQTAVKQAAEFGIFADKKIKSAAPVLLIADVDAVGVQAMQNSAVSAVAYWDLDEPSRALSAKFAKKMGRPPTDAHLMTYSAALHYLKAAKAANSLDTDKIIAKMREMPVNDAVTTNGRVRADGRLLRDVHLGRVKTPEESKYPWDYFKLDSKISGEDAFRPASESVCDLLKKS
jgi:branched-chain amino acid transport system substrate-binding protein